MGNLEIKKINTEQSLPENIKQDLEKTGTQLTGARVRKIIESESVKWFGRAKREINKQVQTDKVSLMTVFGLFVSIISFLTIEFQLLKTLYSWQKILGFSIVLFSLLFGFNVALDYLVKSRSDKETPMPQKWFSWFVFILFVLGVGFMFLGNEEKYRENQIYNRYSEEFESRMNGFKNDVCNEYDQALNAMKTEIKQLDSRITKDICNRKKA